MEPEVLLLVLIRDTHPALDFLNFVRQALMSATSQHRRQQNRQQLQPRAVPGHIVNPSIDVSLPVDHAAVEHEAFLGERTSRAHVEHEESVIEEGKSPSSIVPAIAFATVGIGAALVGSGIFPL
jgi:hypothetical protein